MSTYYSTDFVSRFRNAQRQTGTYSTASRPRTSSTWDANGDDVDTFRSQKTQLIAANESARMWGDPHIDDADGGKYDFQEHGVFNLLEDEGVTLNALLDGPANGPTYIDKAGLVVNNREISISNKGKVVIKNGDDGEDIELKDGETRQLGDGSYITKKGDTITVGTPEYKMEFKTNLLHEGHRYMDITVSTKDGGVALDGTKPTGILGETFDRGSSKLSKTKHDADDYERNSLFETNQRAEAEEEDAPGAQDNSPPCNCPANPGTGTNTNPYSNGNPYNGGSTRPSPMVALIAQFMQILQQWMQYFSGGVRV